MGNRKKAITAAAVEALTPGAIIWDTSVTGFGARCQGQSRVYLVKYRFESRQRWYTIGKHGSPWNPASARKRALRLLGQAADGIDPARIRSDGKVAPTVSDLCDRFLGDYAEVHKKPSSVQNDRANIENHVRPLLGTLKVADVTRTDIDRLKKAIRDGRTARDEKNGPRSRTIVRGGPGVANKTLALLSKMFNQAEVWGWRAEGTNPVRLVERYKARKLERFLSPAEFAALAAALDEAETQGTVSVHAVAAIRLLVLTGARLGEVLGLRWGHVDFEGACLRLPDSKTGAKIVYLNAPALALLNALPRLKHNPYVIAGNQSVEPGEEGAPLVNLQKAWRRIRRRATVHLWAADGETAGLLSTLASNLGRLPTVEETIAAAKEAGLVLSQGLTDVRIHDLRHSFASVGAAGGLSLPMIGKLLGHTQVATTHRYAHLAADPVRAANEAIGQRLAALMREPMTLDRGDGNLSRPHDG